MQRPGAPGVWMEIALDSGGAEVRASARGNRGEQTAAHALGPELGAEHLDRFAGDVRQAAARARPLDERVARMAQALHGAVLREGIDDLRARLGEAAGGPLLVRLAIGEPGLQEVPWEALAAPGGAMRHWGTSPDLLPVRGVRSNEPWQPREVRGAVRVLAIAPAGGAALARLKEALAGPMAAGEVEWLAPIEGQAARLPWLFDRLRCEPIPHVLHFVGHGGVQDGVPVLRLADADGDERWLRVELLGQQLAAGFCSFLRLVVLEACEGARPAAFASAAEILARAGADAVVAHLWPVQADVARAFSTQLYRALAGASLGKGDVARAVSEARRAILAEFEGSAEAFSPVVYLRGPDGVLFDFKGRKVAPPLVLQPAVSDAARAIEPALARIVSRPFSLLLGDRWKAERAALDRFRDKLRTELARGSEPPPAGLPMSALAQRYALRRGADKLGAEFQRAFRAGAEAPPVIKALARALGPGAHATLLRSPLLEIALAEQQPERTIHVIQPDEESTLVLRRAAGGDWEALEAPPASVDLEREIVLLRLYRGYTPEQIFTRPLLTEDDYLLGFRELESALPRDVADEILSTLNSRPALIAGMSLTTWHHRMLLHRLFGRRPVPRGSLAMIEPDDAERELWEKGVSLPGRAGVGVVAASGEDVVGWLEALVAAGGNSR
ncbi:CHAT domain-containing protein [Sorangium sp. So ce185]|uniref:CHAT domain-containing protein n=1 Tax=Sorangium sp. So ce185 TaxID=3133287 RepID=UPI003F62676A